MTVLDITDERAQAMGLPAVARETLSAATGRVVEDGRRALSGNQGASPSVLTALNGCERCFGGVGCGLRVANGDAWESEIHPDSKDRSVDLALLVDHDEGAFLLPVEAKLGLAFACSGEKSGGASVRLVHLEEKHKFFSGLPASGTCIADKLILIVPRDGQEVMWYRIRNWNSIGNRIGKLFSCCLADFCVLLGLGSISKPADCQINKFRFNRLREEFFLPGKMSKVQLATTSECTGCGACKRACKRRAIAMLPREDLNGALRPFVDTRSCTGCRYCEKCCPVIAGENSPAA